MVVPDLHRPAVDDGLLQEVQRVGDLLERVVDALERQNAAQEANAAFAQMLMQGAPAHHAAPAEDGLAPDGLPRKRR